VPGPNILYVSLVGWSVAGVPGALVAVAAMCGPSSLLTLGVARALRSARMARLRFRVQRGFGPLTIGLMLSAGLVLARGADHTPLAIGLTLLTVLILLRTSVHPLLLMAAGAVLGLAGLV
jgi:chromate transporter